GEELLLLLFAAVLQERIADQRVVDRQDDAGRRANAADLFDDEAVGDGVHAGAAVLLGHGDSGESQLAGLVVERTRELARLVDFFRPRRHNLFGEPANVFTQELLLFTEFDL